MKLFDTRRVIVCAGAGGTGKTTIAAALGVFAARLGKRAIVVTIDPARRLKDALGLAELHDTPRRIPLDAPGSLSAMMLEPGPAWDGLITAHAPNALLRDRLLANRFYRRFATELAGAHAYAAVDVLCTLADREEVVIVDTPPIRHAVDLFRAPAKVLAFLETGVLPRALTIYRRFDPPRFARWLLRRLETAVGAAALAEAADFLSALAEMIPVFAERAQQMQALLESDRLGCVLITTPDRRACDEAQRFLQETLELGIRTDLLVLNRSALAAIEMITESDEAIRAELAGTLDPPALDFVFAHLERCRARAELERARIEALGPTHVALPELDRDVHDLASLIAVSTRLEAIRHARAEEPASAEPALAAPARDRSSATCASPSPR